MGRALRASLSLALLLLVLGCETWRSLWAPPAFVPAPGVRLVPVQRDQAPPPQQHEVTIAGDLLQVARVVLLAWRPPQMMPTPETGPSARCVLSPRSYRMDVREDRDRYVVNFVFIKQAECGVFVDTDVTYEVSRDTLEIISRSDELQPDAGCGVAHGGNGVPLTRPER